MSLFCLAICLSNGQNFRQKRRCFASHAHSRKKGAKIGDHYEDLLLKEIVIGDLLLVRTGEKVVLDGVITEGSGLIDEAIMTGEARPIPKKVGEYVIGGSIVQEGSFHFRVSDTKGVLGRVIEAVEQQLERKQPQRRVIDQLLRYFVPSVLALAIGVALLDPLRAIAILLIACPCAIGIAAPLAEARLIHTLAQLGIVVRNRNVLPILAKDPFFVFDKTGTLTEGKFQLLTPCNDPFVKGLAMQSRHPICLALQKMWGKAAVFDQIEEKIGRGMIGFINEERYLLGSTRFLQEQGIEVNVCSDQTVVHFAKDKMVLTLELGDQLRTHLPSVRGMILSGDRPEVVQKVAKACHFERWQANCDPFEKKNVIDGLTGPVVMVGDGVNDAPAMAAAAVGISLSSGTEMAIEVSDLLMTKERLDHLDKLLELAKRGRRILHQNFFWAFVYNLVGIGLALGGYLTPLYAAIAMALSSLCVTLNSLRIKN